MVTSPEPQVSRPPENPGVGPMIALERALSRRALRLMAFVKGVVYRTPGLRNIMLPEYRYWVDPGQLAAMIELIDATRRPGGGAIVEIGVARGYTSVFLLEHLRTTGDDRILVLVDTFDGFTRESVDYEVERRGKRTAELADFSYCDPRILDRSLARLGYANYRIVQEDCSKVDWQELGPVDAVFLDVDLYLPTAATLEALWPQLAPGGGIVLDDCVEKRWCDGAHQAYLEFIDRHDLPYIRVGGKGAALRKPHPDGNVLRQT